MEHTQEELQEMIQGIAPEVVEQEPVYATSRALVKLYNLTDGRTIAERIEYMYPADSEGWAAVLFSTFHIATT